MVMTMMMIMMMHLMITDADEEIVREIGRLGVGRQNLSYQGRLEMSANGDLM